MNPLKVFINEMNRTSNEMLLTNTNFVNANGLSTNNKISALDALKLGICAISYPQIARTITKKESEIRFINNNQEQTIISKHTIFKSPSYKKELKSNYNVLGGKTGTLWIENVRHKNLVLLVQISSFPIMISIFNATQEIDIYHIAKLICDIMSSNINNKPNTTNEELLNKFVENGGSYAACVIPATPSLLMYSTTPKDILLSSPYYICAMEDKPQYAASITKLMTAIVCANNTTDLNDKLFLQDKNNTNDEELLFNKFGSYIAISDAITHMLLTSDNKMANSLAINTGNILINKHFNTLSTDSIVKGGGN